jgi:hypothetical protein
MHIHHDITVPYEWVAVYQDGSVLHQYNDGEKTWHDEIDREGLVMLVVIDQRGKTKLVIHLDKNKRLIWRIISAIGFRGLKERVHLVGWQENRRGQNVQMLCAVFADGTVEIVDRFKEGHPWLSPIIIRKGEEV